MCPNHPSLLILMSTTRLKNPTWWVVCLIDKVACALAICNPANSMCFFGVNTKGQFFCFVLEDESILQSTWYFTGCADLVYTIGAESEVVLLSQFLLTIWHNCKILPPTHPSQSLPPTLCKKQWDKLKDSHNFSFLSVWLRKISPYLTQQDLKRGRRKSRLGESKPSYFSSDIFMSSFHLLFILLYLLFKCRFLYPVFTSCTSFEVYCL